jgi:hypothetical protein
MGWCGKGCHIKKNFKAVKPLSHENTKGHKEEQKKVSQKINPSLDWRRVLFDLQTKFYLCGHLEAMR